MDFDPEGDGVQKDIGSILLKDARIFLNEYEGSDIIYQLKTKTKRREKDLVFQGFFQRGVRV